MVYFIPAPKQQGRGETMKIAVGYEGSTSPSSVHLTLSVDEFFVFVDDLTVLLIPGIESVRVFERCKRYEKVVKTYADLYCAGNRPDQEIHDRIMGNIEYIVAFLRDRAKNKLHRTTAAAYQEILDRLN